MKLNDSKPTMMGFFSVPETDLPRVNETVAKINADDTERWLRVTEAAKTPDMGEKVLLLFDGNCLDDDELWFTRRREID